MKSELPEIFFIYKFLSFNQSEFTQEIHYSE